MQQRRGFGEHFLFFDSVLILRNTTVTCSYLNLPIQTDLPDVVFSDREPSPAVAPGTIYLKLAPDFHKNRFAGRRGVDYGADFALVATGAASSMDFCSADNCSALPCCGGGLRRSGDWPSMPSEMLEQEAHMLGFRDNGFPAGVIGSPQQIHTVGFILGDNY